MAHYPRRKQRRAGFTIMELVLVVSLIVIVGAVSFPTFQSMVGGFRSQAAVDTVRGVWAQARAKAMNDGLPYRFSVVQGKGNYRLAPDVGEFWAGSAASATSNDPNNKPLVIEDALPNTVRFSTPSAAQAGERVGGSEDTTAPSGSIDVSSWNTVVVFLPDGTARDNAELVILTAGARRAGSSCEA